LGGNKDLHTLAESVYLQPVETLFSKTIKSLVRQMGYFLNPGQYPGA